MIETNMSAHVLTYDEVYGDLQAQPWWKNMPNMPILNTNIVPRGLQWLSMVMYDWKWYDSMIWFRVNGVLQCKKFDKNLP